MNNYIGKKLSLISKSDIRYEGIVHSIDPASSALTLQQGASTG
jgi:protein LSM14